MLHTNQSSCRVNKWPCAMEASGFSKQILLFYGKAKSVCQSQTLAKLKELPLNKKTIKSRSTMFDNQ